MIMGGWSEEITQSSLLPVLYINPELPRRSTELKQKQPSGDDGFTPPCYHVSLHIPTADTLQRCMQRSQ